MNIFSCQAEMESAISNPISAPPARAPRQLIPALAFVIFLGAPAAQAATPAPVEVAPTAPQVAYLKRLSLEQLLELEVTSVSRRAEPYSTAASAISVLTGDDVRRTGATTLADALRFSTGLEVARIDGRTWGIASRGFNLSSSNKLLVMQDGRSLYTPLFAGVLWDVQDTEFADLDRIEIVRGPGASLWGANAVNGVINIQTKSARDTQGTLISAGGGNEEQQFASVRHGLQLGEGLYARVYAKEFRRDDLRLLNHADANDDWRMWQGGFRVDRQKAGEPGTVTLQGDIYHGFLGTLTRVPSRVAGGNILGRWKHQVSTDGSMQVQGYYDRVERFVPGQFREGRDTLDVDAQYDTPVGKRQHVTAGVTARTSADKTDPTGTVRFSPVNRRMTVVSGLVQDEISFAEERVGVILGAKFERNTSTGFEFQPSLRAAWHPTANQTVWSAISRAVRTPSRFDDNLQVISPPSTVVVRGDPSFQSEQLTAYELGYRIHPHVDWAIDLSLFENRYDKLRSQERGTPPDAFFILRNRLNARTRGGDISIVSQLSPIWRTRVMYSRLYKHLRLDPGSTDPTGGMQEGNDPKHILTFVSTLDLPHSWELDASVRRISTLPSPVVPTYTELDVHLGWRPSRAWEFSVVGQNLLHEGHREFGAAGPAARELQRSYYGKVTWRH